MNDDPIFSWWMIHLFCWTLFVLFKFESWIIWLKKCYWWLLLENWWKYLMIVICTSYSLNASVLKYISSELIAVISIQNVCDFLINKRLSLILVDGFVIIYAFTVIDMLQVIGDFHQSIMWYYFIAVFFCFCDILNCDICCFGWFFLWIKLCLV